MVRGIGVAHEPPVSGTYTDPTFYFDPLREGVALNENVNVPDTISTRAGRRAFLTHQDSSGQIEFILDTTIASFFLSAVCGGCTEATGDITVELCPTASRKTLPAISVYINSLYFLRKIAGAGVKRVTIRSDAGPGNLPTIQVEFVGGTETKTVADTNLDVSSFNELGKILANTTAAIGLADKDETVGTEVIKTKSFEIVIEPTFKEDPVIGEEGLPSDMYYPESWRFRFNMTFAYTPLNVQWLSRYMGSDINSDADGIGDAIVRAWDAYQESTKFPLQAQASFDYGGGYDLLIDMKNAVIIEQPDYNEEGKTIKDISIVLEALHYDDAGTDKTFQAVIGNSTFEDEKTDLPGYHV